MPALSLQRKINNIDSCIKYAYEICNNSYIFFLVHFLIFKLFQNVNPRTFKTFICQSFVTTET